MSCRPLGHICQSLLGSLKCQPLPRHLRWHSYSWSFIPSSCTKRASCKQDAPPWQAESNHCALLNLRMPCIYLLAISQVWTLFILLCSESVRKGKIPCSVRTEHGLRMRRQGPKQTLCLLFSGRQSWILWIHGVITSYNRIQCETRLISTETDMVEQGK